MYIGQTTRSLKKRMYDHIAKANLGMQRKFQKAIAELGKEKFKIEQICICSDAKTADELELYYIKKYNSIENGYNSRELAEGSFNRGSQNGMYGKKGKVNPVSRPIIAVKYDDSIYENLEEAKKETKISKATITNRIKNGIKNEDKSYFVYDLKIFK